MALLRSCSFLNICFFPQSFIERDLSILNIDIFLVSLNIGCHHGLLLALRIVSGICCISGSFIKDRLPLFEATDVTDSSCALPHVRFVFIPFRDITSGHY